MISMKRPSRGLVESATTMRYVGVFFRPVRRRRMRTMFLRSYQSVMSCSSCSGLIAPAITDAIPGCEATPGSVYDGVRAGGTSGATDNGYYEPDSSSGPPNRRCTLKTG